MTKGKQDKDSFIKSVYSQGSGHGVVASRLFLFNENEGEERKKKKEEFLSDDTDISHLSDERYEKSSPHPPVRKKKHPYSFVR